MKRVVLIDDDIELLDCMLDEFESHDFKVYAFTDPTLAVTKLPLIEPELVVVDWMMPKLTGLEVLKGLKNLRIDPIVVMLTGWESAEIAETFTANAHAFLRKPASVKDILSIFSRFSKDIRPFTFNLQPENLQSLSKREREVFNLISSGLSSKEIAKRFFISQRTVEKHRENIRKRLETKSFTVTKKHPGPNVNMH